MTFTRTALVLGASGGIGGELARQLQAAGWQVRALNRSAARVAEGADGLQWRHGDAMNRADVVAAAQGVSVIVHAVNPPGYRRWGELVLPMMANTLAAAQAVGARIVLPGTLYNYGPDAFAHPLAEGSPQNPLTRKGALRVEMERRLEAAAARGVRSLIVRAGDYFGPKAGNNWFSQALVQPGRVPTVVRTPGAGGVGHQWGYLPDVARTMLLLIEREAALPPFARFHMGGHWDATGMQLPQTIARIVREGGTAAREPTIRAFPWWAVRLASPLVPLCREMAEMRYLWQQPIRMDNTRLLGALGAEPHTPLADAVRHTLAGLGCMAPPGAAPINRPSASAAAPCPHR